ncbi:MAG TPA: peptidylprolyl isomerase [Pilimelia sp.]|nr:peptidylprolyl isomerase [Pilimelia sp.]
MASSKDRQRKLARAKLDRQMARRAATQRRRRQVNAAIVTGLAVLLVTVGSVWLLGGFSGDPEPAAAEDQCTWSATTANPSASPSPSASANPTLKDVGKPPTKGLPTTGKRPMTITTNSGTVGVQLDLAPSACAGASIAHLAGKQFYDNTKCHELTDSYLHCGDPSGTGQGGPTYSFTGENVPPPAATPPAASPGASPPAAAGPLYPRGTVALIASTPGNYGSQFVIFHKDFTMDQPAYSIIGRVTSGLDVVDKIVKAGTVDNGSGARIKPAKDVTVQSVTVGAASGATPSPAPTPAGSPSPAAAGSPSPAAQS